jgi:biopolymer transport protein ExbB
MRRFERRPVLAAALLAVCALPAPLMAANSLDQLLEETRTLRAREAQVNEAREREFQANRDRQAELLAAAEAKRKAAEARSADLSARFDANEVALTDLETKLRNRLGILGELFGVTRQVAGDAATLLNQSMISGAFPEREEFLRKLADAKELPSITELERLWFEIQREMTESGRVARLRTNVIDPSGTKSEAEVVRIGPFTAISNGRYLTYLPAQRALSVLPRQLGGDFADAARTLEKATSGYGRAAVDPSRGVLLALYVERPTVRERIEHGELVGYIILAVGFLGAVAFVYQLLFLVWTRLQVRQQLQRLDRPEANNPLGRVLLAFRGDAARIEEDAEIAELRISEAVLREVPRIERFQAFLRLAVAAGPLLGLVGTVVGMIITFQSITESGSSDPKLMAQGIGQAMIATVLGLGIAIPLLFANAGLAALSRQIVTLLEEQSTGLLAASLENQRQGNGERHANGEQHGAAA